MPPSLDPDLEVAAVVVAGGVLREQRLGPVQVGGAEPELDRALCQVETPARRQSRHSRPSPFQRQCEPPVGAGRRGLSRHRPPPRPERKRQTVERPQRDRRKRRHRRQGTACRRAARRPTARRRPARRPAGRRPALRSTCRRPSVPISTRSSGAGPGAGGVSGPQWRGRGDRRRRGRRRRLAVEAAVETGRRRRSRRRGRRSRLSARPSPLTCWLAPRVIGSAFAGAGVGKTMSPPWCGSSVDLDAVDIEPGAALAEDEGPHVQASGLRRSRPPKKPVAFSPASWRRTLMPPSSIRISRWPAVVVAGGVPREQRLGPVQVGGAEPELDRALCQGWNAGASAISA